MAGPRKKILFLCSSDYGQANVILATAYAILAAAGADAPEIHIGSEHPMEPEVKKAVRMADETLTSTAPHRIHFHGIRGVSQFQAMMRPEVGTAQAWELPLPNFLNAASFMRGFARAALPWELSELADIYPQVVDIIRAVGPDLMIVDPVHVPALTAAFNSGMKWTVLAPNTIKDFAVPLQPRAAALWKYPVLGSALPFPIPWRHVPMNAGLLLILAFTMLTTSRMADAEKVLREAAGDTSLKLITLAELGVVSAPPPGVRVLCAMSEDLDYPFDVLPDHVTPCGPIVRPSRRLAEVDPALERWLARGPTVYVNLGTQFAVKPHEALEFALALRDLLDAADVAGGAKGADGRGRLQVLWKLKRRDASGQESWDGELRPVYDTLESEMTADRVRITSWVEADPCAILQSGHVACSVHHGGANSHHEALAAGVPQVLVPGWIDCYDFGNRVELNGVGVWANKGHAPRWERVELGGALKRVLVAEREGFRERAREVSVRHPEHAGRDKAAGIILDIVGK